MRVKTSTRGSAGWLRGASGRRRIAMASVVLVTLTTAAACHGTSAATSSQPTKGGTLNVILSNNGITNLDPQGISLATDANFSHLVDRTLTTTNAAGQLVPDLATDTGRPSADDRTWEFTLRPGVRWQDGSPVTCQDVQYGIERRFASVINNLGGLPYPLQYLVDNTPSYTGPFTQKSLNSIVCVDSRTIQFHLKQAFGDFGYTVSVNTFAPMKDSADVDHKNDGSAKSTDYDPFSDGPYKVDPTKSKIESTTDAAGKHYYLSSLTLVRNTFWDPSTDPTRKAYPDQVVMSYKPERPTVTNALIQSTDPFYQNAISLDADVTPNFVQQVINDPDLSKRAVSGVAGATRYFAINVRQEPNKTCRQAMEFAFDKRSWRYEVGGSAFGDLATSLIPPNLPAHLKFDDYDTNTQQDGEPTKAASMWQQAKCKSSIKVAYPDVSGLAQTMSTVVQAYQKAGITVDLVALPTTVYYQSIGDPHEAYDMVYAGWVPDWPNGSAVIPPLFSSGQVTAALADPAADDANLNFSMVVNKSLEDQINQAFAVSDMSAQYTLWGQADKTIMDQAYAIPVLYIRALRMEGTKVRGGAITPAYGEPDLSTLGVAP